MTRNYPQYARQLVASSKNLAGQIPDTMSAFARLHKATMADGSLTRKNKELIAVGIAIGARCDGCISSHVSGALRAGASSEEVAETIGVAILMGGGPATVYGAEAFEALRQFEAARG